MTPTRQTTSSNWISRNWKWFVPLWGLVIMVGLAGFVALLLSTMKSSDAYSGALARAQASPAVIAALGSPIKDGFFFTGRISVNNSSGSANLVIPLSGPKAGAHLYVSATRTQGQWHYDSLIVELAATGQRLDITGTNQLPASGTPPAGK